MSYIGKQPTKAPLTASDIEDGIITAAKIEDGAVVAAEIASNAVTTAKINADAVTGAKIADDAINSEHYTDGSVDTAHIADANVTTAKIADDAVTYAKIQNVSATDRILGRDSSGAGVIEEITPANLRTMLNVADGATAGGGIENITTYRITTNFTMTQGADITANLSTGGASLGTAISESSGVFTFPQTGFYMIESQLFLQRLQGDSDYVGIEIKATTNNSSYATIFQNYTNIDDTADEYNYVYGSTIFDVTDVSNYKVKLAYQSQSATNIRVVGNSSMDRSFIRFIRLGAT